MGVELVLSNLSSSVGFKLIVTRKLEERDARMTGE